jgi:hypothetical protein
MELEFSQQIFKKYWNIKINANTSRGSKVVLCGQTDRQMDGQTNRQRDMIKLIVTFHNFVNTPEKKSSNFYIKNTLFI